MSKYYVGSAIRTTVVVKNAAGTAIDPTTLKVAFTAHSGYTKTYVYLTDAELVKDSTGNYHADYVIENETGKWRYKWTATGTGAGVAKGEFTVDE